jgi:hypothetical protein
MASGQILEDGVVDGGGFPFSQWRQFLFGIWPTDFLPQDATFPRLHKTLRGGLLR